MALKKHYIKMFWELMMCYGFVMLILTIYHQLSDGSNPDLHNIWAFLLLSCALVFRFESFINFHDLEDHLMRINYLMTSVMADISLIVLLYYFTSGGKYFQFSAKSVLIVYIVAKGAVYLMVYVQAKQAARAINKKLTSEIFAQNFPK